MNECNEGRNRGLEGVIFTSVWDMLVLRHPDGGIQQTARDKGWLRIKI